MEAVPVKTMTQSRSSPHFVAVTGLPRAGSTLMTQLLAQHPDIASNTRSSALANLLLTLRRAVSDDTFFLSHLDQSFEEAYGQLDRGMTGFLRGWLGAEDKGFVVDKNRAWLHSVEFLLRLAPEAKLVVCLRDLAQIYGSIEAQHQRTILLDFPDRLADFDRLGRADQLFGKDRVLGAPLVSLAAVQDFDQSIRDRMYFVRFEDLIEDPAASMERLFAWIGAAPHAIDLNNLARGVSESDSHYRFKFRHAQATRIAKPSQHALPLRIQGLIDTAYGWYYQTYYRDRPEGRRAALVAAGNVQGAAQAQGMAQAELMRESPTPNLDPKG